MGVHVFKKCGNCGYSASNYSSSYNQSNCPSCGSSSWVSESYEKAANREREYDNDRVQDAIQDRADAREEQRHYNSW